MNVVNTFSLVQLLSRSALGAEFSGSIFTEDGAAVTSAQVTVYNNSLRRWSTTSNSEGYFSISELPAGSYRALIVPAYSDNLLATFASGPGDFEPILDICSTTAVNLDSAGEHELHHVLSAGLIVTGQIHDAANTALENVECWLEGHENNDGLSIPRGALSNDQGQFSIAGVPANQALRFRFTSDTLPEQFDGGELTVIEDALSAEHWFTQDTLLPTSFQLLTGVRIEGLIYSGSLAIAGADVTVYSGGQLTRTTSSQDGVYSVQGLPAGDALAWAAAPGWATTYSPNTDRPQSFLEVGPDGANTNELNIEMPKESTLRIALTDSTNGTGINGASVLLYNDNKTVGRGLPVNDEGVALFEGLHPGTYSLRIFAENDGYSSGLWTNSAGEEEQIELLSETHESVEIALDPKRSLNGTILFSDLQPIDTALIQIIDEDQETASVRSNEYGEFTVWGLGDGPYQITVQYGPYCGSDRAAVSWFTPGTYDPRNPVPLSTDELEELLSTPIILPIDQDHDSMDDWWESEQGLDTNRDDSLEDPDGDGKSNLEEYWDGETPKFSEKQSECGCSTSSALLLMAVLFPLGVARRES